MRSMPSDVQRGAHADDVDDRVERADLVELDVVGVDAVHLRPRPRPDVRKTASASSRDAVGRSAASISASTSDAGRWS